MDFLASFFAQQGVQLVMAGASGGIARALFLKVKLVDAMGSIVLGAILGFYVSPQFESFVAPALSGFSTDPARLPAFTAFATGVGGIGIVGFIYDWLNSRGKQLKIDAGVESPKGDSK